MQAPSPIAVVVLTHNGERFVREQVRSILEQSALPTEVVVSDDASGDFTVREVEAAVSDAGARAAGVRVVIDCHEQLGVVANLERAVTQTSSDLIALADQDDVWARE